MRLPLHFFIFGMIHIAFTAISTTITTILID
jgi:hypothetical protein